MEDYREGWEELGDGGYRKSQQEGAE